MLKEGMGVEIDTKAFPKPPIFDLIQKMEIFLRKKCTTYLIWDLAL